MSKKCLFNHYKNLKLYKNQNLYENLNLSKITEKLIKNFLQYFWKLFNYWKKDYRDLIDSSNVFKILKNLFL